MSDSKQDEFFLEKEEYKAHLAKILGYTDAEIEKLLEELHGKRNAVFDSLKVLIDSQTIPVDLRIAALQEFVENILEMLAATSPDSIAIITNHLIEKGVFATEHLPWENETKH